MLRGGVATFSDVRISLLTSQTRKKLRIIVKPSNTSNQIRMAKSDKFEVVSRAPRPAPYQPPFSDTANHADTLLAYLVRERPTIGKAAWKKQIRQAASISTAV